MRTTKKLIVSALAGAGVLGLAAFPANQALASRASIASQASRAGGPALGLTSFHQMAVSGNEVFLTGAPGSGSGIVVTDLSGRPLATLDSGSDVAGIAIRGSTLYARLTSGREAGSLAAISLGSGAGSLAEHYVSLLGGVLPSGLQGLSSALSGAGPAGGQAHQNVSQAGNKATGSGSVIKVLNPDGSTANVLSLGDRTLAPGGLAWAGNTLIAVTKDAGGLFRVVSFLNAAVHKVTPKVPLPSTEIPTGLPTAVPTRLPTKAPSPAPTKSGKTGTGKLPADLTISAPSRATYKPTIAVKVHLGSASANRTVSVYAQPPGSGKKLVKKGTVDAFGDLTVNYTTAYTTTFTAVYSGDSAYAAKSVSAKTTVVPSMSLAVNGWYATKKIGGTTYLEYHKANDIDVDLTVGPNKSGQCVWFQIQELYGATWHANMKTSCVPLSSASKLSGYLTVNNADAGYHYRVAAHYLPAKGDGWNGGAVTGWQYLLPEN